MPALIGYASEGVLTINGTALNTPATYVGGDENGEGSLIQLWGLMSERKGADRALPGSNGAIPYPRLLTVTPYDLRTVIIGDVTTAGVANSDDRIGLQTNLAAFKTLIDTAASGDGTVTASLTRFTGAAITAPVHVVRLEHETISYSVDGTSGSIFIGRLRLEIPSGRLS